MSDLNLRFMQGGGDLGRLIRELDWASTPLGAPSGWPQSLKTALGILLNSRFPMFMYWGPEYICIYNDAYRQILGNEGKHPHALGRPGKEVFPEIWALNEPVLDAIMAGGESTREEDQLLQIYRNGRLEDMYWTYSYSPVPGDTGVDGVFVTCVETTAAVQSRRQLRESEARFRNLLRKTNVGIVLLEGPQLEVTMVNEAYARMVGHPLESLMDRPIFDVLPEAKGFFKPIIDAVIRTGEEYHLNGVPYTVIAEDGMRIDGFLNLVYQAYRESDQQISGVIVVVQDATSQAGAMQAIAESEARARALIEESPVASCLFTGREMRISIANQKMLDTWGRGPEVLDMPLEQAVPELRDQPFPKLLDAVFTTGESYEGTAAPAIHFVNGVPKTLYFDFVYKPLRNTGGEVYAVMVVAIDVTDRFLAKEQVDASRRELLALFEQSPVAIATIGKENLTFRMVNPFYAELVGRTPEQLVNRPLIEALPEIGKQEFPEILRNVIATGTPFIAHEIGVDLQRDGELKRFYVNLAYQPMRDPDGTIGGILVVATDITPQVISRRQIAESEEKLRGVIAAAPAGIGLFIGRDLVIESPNQTFIDIVGKGPDIVGLPLREAMPELITEGQPFLKILDDVYTTGVPFISAASLVRIVQNGVLNDSYYNISYTPLRNTDGGIYGILDIAIDVTAQVKAQQALDESEARLRSLITTAPVAIAILLGENHIFSLPNQAFFDAVGKGSDIEGLPLEAVLPELAGEGQPFLEILKEVYQTGRTFMADSAPVRILRDGVLVTDYFNITLSPLYDTDGRIYGVLDISVNVTDAVLARLEVEAKERALATAIELAELATWSMSIPEGTMSYSARLQEWLGVTSANIADAAIPRVIPEDRQRVAAALREAMDAGGDGRFDETYTITHARTGRSRVIHAIGETRYDAEGQAVLLNGTAQDITDQRNLEAALGLKVQRRTEELAAAIEELRATNEELSRSNEQLGRSNDELAQFAYVASHDLQEPLRKIRVFSGMLGADPAFPQSGRQTLEKISNSAKRMAMLIQDLLAFSKLLKSDALMRPVDLRETVASVWDDFELVVEERAAVLEADALPTVEAVNLQMNQLFYNLIGNALKFTHADRPPVIRVSSRAIPDAEVSKYPIPFRPGAQYHEITVRDNGIGFGRQYSEQIFEVFKRLHRREHYPGSGIGLALCRRIVVNHGGYLHAVSEEGIGSAFHIILPQSRPDQGPVQAGGNPELPGGD